MVSVTGATGNYLIQAELFEKHTITLDWLSSSMLWKSELTAFQKILDERAPLLTSIADKKNIDHFQNLILYYKGEVVDRLRKKLRDHETRLAHMLESKDELHTEYFKEHDDIMDQMETFASLFKQYRKEFFEFILKSK